MFMSMIVVFKDVAGYFWDSTPPFAASMMQR
jgi:hypothetical protein